MKRFRRLSHSLYECKYHIVFCPKYRYRILKEDIAEYTRQQIYHLSFAHFKSTFANLGLIAVILCLERLYGHCQLFAKGVLSANHAEQR